MAASVPVLLFAQTWSARPPRVIFRSEPEYSEEARRAGVNATINVSLVVGEDGVPRDIGQRGNPSPWRTFRYVN
jgi:hypothetical protein